MMGAITGLGTAMSMGLGTLVFAGIVIAAAAGAVVLVCKVCGD